jgi:hypothetical protein
LPSSDASLNGSRLNSPELPPPPALDFEVLPIATPPELQPEPDTVQSAVELTVALGAAEPIEQVTPSPSPQTDPTTLAPALVNVSNASSPDTLPEAPPVVPSTAPEEEKRRAPTTKAPPPIAPKPQISRDAIGITAPTAASLASLPIPRVQSPDKGPSDSPLPLDDVSGDVSAPLIEQPCAVVEDEVVPFAPPAPLAQPQSPPPRPDGSTPTLEYEHASSPETSPPPLPACSPPLSSASEDLLADQEASIPKTTVQPLHSPSSSRVSTPTPPPHEPELPSELAITAPHTDVPDIASDEVAPDLPSFEPPQPLQLDPVPPRDETNSVSELDLMVLPPPPAVARYARRSRLPLPTLPSLTYVVTTQPEHLKLTSVI